MRTLVLCYESVILDAILELDKNGTIEFVNIMSEKKCNHEKEISRLDFITFGYSEETLKLIEKYSQNVEYDDTIYNNLYKNMYRYMCNIGRHNKDFQAVSDTDYIHSFNLIYKFLYGYLIKEKIELVIFDHEPHVGYDDILYDLCKEFKIKTIILQSCLSPLSNIPFLQYAFDKENGVEFNNMNKKYRDVNEEIISNFSFNHCYMHNIMEYNYDIELLEKHHIFKILFHGLFNKNKLKKYVLKYIVANNDLAKLRKIPMYLMYKYCIKKYTQQPNWNEKFVYFPLHLQPELTTSVNGGIYCDQVLAIERLSKKIPKDWYIYVKENPKQNEYMRGVVFFKRLHQVPNVKFIDVNVPSAKLLEKCQFCASIDGTASFESICGGKPTLIFGKVWWDFLPGVFKYSKDIDIDSLLKYKIDLEQLKKEYNEYLSRTMIGTLYPPEGYIQYCPELTKEKNTENIVTLLTDLISDVCI